MYLKFSPLPHQLYSHLMDTFWPDMWCTESEAADATHWHRVDLTCDQWTEGRVVVAVCVSIQLSSVQSLSCVRVFATPWITAHQASLAITSFWSFQTHVHWVSDAIQPSNPLSSPSPPALNLSQHQGLFQWVSISHQVAKVLEVQLQHQSFQWMFRTNIL